MLAATVAAPAFAPVERNHYRLTAVETRSDGATTMRFTATRDIVFTREHAGWRAESTLVALTHDAPATVARVQDAALAPLLGHAMVLHLDANGKVVAIDDRDTIWDAIVAGLSGAGDGSSARSASLKRMAAPMAALPAAQRLDMLGAEITDLAAGSDAALEPGSVRPVTLASAALPDVPVTLTGVRTVSASGNLLIVATHAQGSLPGDPPTGVSIVTEQRIDRQRGLVIGSLRRTETTVGTGPDTRRSVTELRVDLTPVS